MPTKKFDLEITGPTTAYLRLPTHPGILRNAKTATLVDHLGAYEGPYVVFDFDSNSVLVGVEVVGDDNDDDGENEAKAESFNKDASGFQLKVSEDDGDVAYLRLPSHPGDSLCKTSKSIRLRAILGDYKGPDIVLDFDMQDVLVGIEILA